MTTDGGSGLGHLHEGEDALLHAGTAAEAEDHQGQTFGGGGFHGAGHALAHRFAHATHEEAGVEGTGDAFHIAHQAPTADHGLRQAGLLAGGIYLVGIAREVDGVSAH